MIFTDAYDSRYPYRGLGRRQFPRKKLATSAPPVRKPSPDPYSGGSDHSHSDDGLETYVEHTLSMLHMFLRVL